MAVVTATMAGAGAGDGLVYCVVLPCWWLLVEEEAQVPMGVEVVEARLVAMEPDSLVDKVELKVMAAQVDLMVDLMADQDLADLELPVFLAQVFLEEVEAGAVILAAAAAVEVVAAVAVVHHSQMIQRLLTNRVSAVEMDRSY